MLTALFGLGCFVLGVAVSKNLRRFYQTKLKADPVGALTNELDELKRLIEKARSW